MLGLLWLWLDTSVMAIADAWLDALAMINAWLDASYGYR
jgi:hypothetical protein